MTSRTTPNSIMEKAQSSIEPKAMGVKIRIKMSINLIVWLSMAFQKEVIPSLMDKHAQGDPLDNPFHN
jgi:hypothetical protein